jgi:hypothetical protein
MAKVDDLTVEVSVEAIFQKALFETVEKIYLEHGLKIKSVDFDWVELVGVRDKLVGCETSSVYDKRSAAKNA